MPTADSDPFLSVFADLSDGEDDPDGPLLREFLGKWEGAAAPEDRAAVLSNYSEDHPRLAGRFRGLVDAACLVRDATEPGPTQLGPYRIVRVLAVGGMGRVYEAEDVALPRTVAVKTIRLGRAADARLFERFDHERKALARLHHTHIVPIYHAGEDNGLLYFAMPLIKGLSLADLLQTMSRWANPRNVASTATWPPATWEEVLGKASTDATWRRSVKVMTEAHGGTPSPEPKPDRPATGTPPLTSEYFRHIAEVVAVAAEALHSAHEAGVIHFDVKPSNILIERQSGRNQTVDHPWVIDFGLADISEAGAEAASPERRDQRTRGFGTKGFMAPEMLERRDAGAETRVPAEDVRAPLDRHADIWGLGVTLYQLLTLRLPFADDEEVKASGARPPLVASPPRRDHGRRTSGPEIAGRGTEGRHGARTFARRTSGRRRRVSNP